MRTDARCSRWFPAVLLLLGLLPFAASAADESGLLPLGREQLVGTWRLTGIIRVTPSGQESDPFYGDHCTGLLIYDRTGWMSVQIAASTRPDLPTPDARIPGSESRMPGPAGEAQRERALFATYYAYFGTWSYDSARGTVLHRVISSLYPAEQGLTYSQEVRLNGSKMIFTVRSHSAQGETRQVKIWERVTPVD